MPVSALGEGDKTPLGHIETFNALNVYMSRYK